MDNANADPMHWVDLRNASAEFVLKREGVRRSADSEGYVVRFLNAEFHVDPAGETIRELSPEPDRPVRKILQILLLNYLVAEYGGPLDGEEATEKALPGGTLFFQGPHALETGQVIERFKSDAEGFEALGVQHGGVPVEGGDRAIRFHPFPLMPVTYVLWIEDDEFPATVSVLFDRSITRWFELDMVYSLVYELTHWVFRD